MRPTVRLQPLYHPFLHLDSIHAILTMTRDRWVNLMSTYTGPSRSSPGSSSALPGTLFGKLSNPILGTDMSPNLCDCTLAYIETLEPITARAEWSLYLRCFIVVAGTVQGAQPRRPVDTCCVGSSSLRGARHSKNLDQHDCRGNRSIFRLCLGRAASASAGPASYAAELERQHTHAISWPLGSSP